MTTPPPDQHADLEVLAHLDEGLLPPEQAAAARNHLTDCVRCRDTHDRLQAVGASLRSLPAEPMPAAVAERIDAALAGATATVTPLAARSRSSWRRHPTAAGLSAVAAAVALIAAVVLGTTLHGSSSGGPAESPAAGAAGAGAAPNPKPYPVTASGRTYTAANTGELAASLLHRHGSLHGSVLDNTTRVPAPSPADSAATQTFAKAMQSAPRPLRSTLATPQGLATCVGTLTRGTPGATVLAVDFGRYTGDPGHHVRDPAAVIVLSGVLPGKKTAFVVGPRCATDPNDVFYRFEVLPAGS